MPSDTRSIGEVVAEIKMTRANPMVGAIVVVEGPDDAKFWAKFVRPEVEIILACGVKNALAAAQSGHNAPHVLTLVDRDYRTLCGIADPPEVVATDFCSLECSLITTNALEMVLHEYGERSRVTNFIASHGSILNAVLSRSARHGYIRWLSEHRQLGVNFARVSIRTSLGRDWVVNNNWTDRELVNAGHFSSEAEVQPALDSLGRLSELEVSHGHDIVDVIALSLEHVLGTSSAGRGSVATLLRAGFTKEDLWRTAMYEKIKDWEQSHTSTLNT